MKSMKNQKSWGNEVHVSFFSLRKIKEKVQEDNTSYSLAKIFLDPEIQ